VLIVVMSAVAFLVGRNVTLRRRQKRPAQTFIPLSSLRRPAAPSHSDDDPGCH
jgi:hypothetical protein